MAFPPSQTLSLMSRQRWLLLGGLYLSQYVGQAFLLISLIAIARKSGFPLEKLGLVYITALCWIFKFLWSPLIDKFRPMGGRYKGWLLITQSGMGLSLFILSFMAMPYDFYLIVVVGTIHSFFSASQDVVSDGLSRTLLAPSERAVGVSVQAIFGLLGNVIGGGVVLALYPYLGWAGCCHVLLAVVGICFVQCLFFQEPLTRVDNSRVSFLRLVQFWRTDHNLTWALILTVYASGVGLAWGTLPTLLTELKWSYGEIGFTINVSGSIVAMLGAALSGLILKKIGRAAMFKLMFWAPIFGFSFISIILSTTGSGALVFLIPQLFFLIISPALVLIPTMIMDRSSALTPSTDYTAQFCLLTVSQYLAASFGTAFGHVIGFSSIFIIGAAIEILAFLFGLNRVSKGVIILNPKN
ncbi:MAG: MFS transporter [Deltaproteobacteria bacterium]|jgi:MFS family permease|nr:MFS transporter [Deltaproteobacteria bacterium]